MRGTIHVWNPHGMHGTAWWTDVMTTVQCLPTVSVTCANLSSPHTTRISANTFIKQSSRKQSTQQCIPLTQPYFPHTCFPQSSLAGETKPRRDKLLQSSAWLWLASFYRSLGKPRSADGLSVYCEIPTPSKSPEDGPAKHVHVHVHVMCMCTVSTLLLKKLVLWLTYGAELSFSPTTDEHLEHKNINSGRSASRRYLD